jgi:hypothetical protein
MDLHDGEAPDQIIGNDDGDRSYFERFGAAFFPGVADLFFFFFDAAARFAAVPAFRSAAALAFFALPNAFSQPDA